MASPPPPPSRSPSPLLYEDVLFLAAADDNNEPSTTSAFASLSLGSGGGGSSATKTAAVEIKKLRGREDYHAWAARVRRYLEIVGLGGCVFPVDDDGGRPSSSPSSSSSSKSKAKDKGGGRVGRPARVPKDDADAESTALATILHTCADEVKAMLRARWKEEEEEEQAAAIANHEQDASGGHVSRQRNNTSSRAMTARWAWLTLSRLYDRQTASSTTSASTTTTISCASIKNLTPAATSSSSSTPTIRQETSAFPLMQSAYANHLTTTTNTRGGTPSSTSKWTWANQKALLRGPTAHRKPCGLCRMYGHDEWHCCFLFPRNDGGDGRGNGGTGNGKDKGKGKQKEKAGGDKAGGGGGGGGLMDEEWPPLPGT